jgi:hypothetical protein
LRQTPGESFLQPGLCRLWTRILAVIHLYTTSCQNIYTFFIMTLKRHLKAGIRLVIEADGNPVTLVMRLSKTQIIRVLDYVLPDDVETEEPASTKFDLRKDK